MTQIELIREVQVLREINTRLADEITFLRSRLVANDRAIRDLHDDLSRSLRRPQNIYIQKQRRYDGPDWPGVL